MAGQTIPTSTSASYDGGFSMARRDMRTMDDGQRDAVLTTLRAYLDAESTNKYARAFAAGACDALAPFRLYA